MEKLTSEHISQVSDEWSKGAYQFRLRRQPDWDENYTLYRNRVFYNRITQRQSVSVPLMKYVVRSVLKEIDDPAELYFRNRDNDKQKEVLFNEYWQKVREDQNIDVKDIGDKKQDILYGRTTSTWNIVDGRMIFDLEDTYDMFFDQFTNPFDIDGSANLMERRHNFMPLSSLRTNESYDKSAVAKIESFYGTQAGVQKAAENERSNREKNARLEDMGATQINDPEVGETLVELVHRWVRIYDPEVEEMCIYFLIKCDDEVLFCKPQEEITGETEDHYWRNHFTATSWGDDVERNDVYSDAVADMIRPIARIINAFFSQDIENRTLRSFHMNFYDTSMEDFTPQTFEPTPFGFYPISVPAGKNIRDVIFPMPVDTLADAIPHIQFLIGLAEKSAATTSTQNGSVNQQKVTLGEVELVLQEAKDRLKAFSKFYVPAWKERGVKFMKMLEAAHNKIGEVTVYKKGYRGNIFKQTMIPEDWMTPNGYEVEIISKSDLKARAIETINTINAVKQAMPGNLPLEEIAEQKMLDLIPDINPEQARQVLEFQKKRRKIQEQTVATTGATDMGMQGGSAMANQAAQTQLPVAGG